ncbi:MAG: ATP cone domain-containing protein [Clostridiaceae bacterium]
MKRKRIMEALIPDKIHRSIGRAFIDMNLEVSEERLDMLTEEVLKKLEAVGTELYTENIHHLVMDTLEENGYDSVSNAYGLYQANK